MKACKINKSIVDDLCNSFEVICSKDNSAHLRERKAILTGLKPITCTVIEGNCNGWYIILEGVSIQSAIDKVTLA